jgi:hypothetical protein
MHSMLAQRLVSNGKHHRQTQKREAQASNHARPLHPPHAALPGLPRCRPAESLVQLRPGRQLRGPGDNLRQHTHSQLGLLQL